MLFPNETGTEARDAAAEGSTDLYTRSFGAKRNTEEKSQHRQAEDTADVIDPAERNDAAKDTDGGRDTAAAQVGMKAVDGDVECRAEEIDLIIVPARAFTASGERLGRGGGFYDKYMSLNGFRAHKTGIAFRCQIFDSLPTDPHDIKVDEVVTE